jgi:hypothetical protein
MGIETLQPADAAHVGYDANIIRQIDVFLTGLGL